MGRIWPGPTLAADYGGPLNDFMGAVARGRAAGVAGRSVATEAGTAARHDGQQLRVIAAEQQSDSSGARWRATVSAEHRFRIEQMIAEAREQLVQLSDVHSGTTAEVARTLLQHLSHSAALIDQAFADTAVAAVAAGVVMEGGGEGARHVGARGSKPGIRRPRMAGGLPTG